MTTEAIAVIGAAFGDEGKGRMVDHFAQPGSLVVRFNGGAQAAHTVHNGDRHHIFKHIGAGTFKGASTYLSEYFIANPFLYCDERDTLMRNNPSLHVPKIYVNPNASVTTPYDMLINQALENARGSNRHGSCGYGINETVERSAGAYALTVNDLAGDLPAKLRLIRDEYLPERLKALGLSVDQLSRLLQICPYNETIFNKYLACTARFLAETESLLTCNIPTISQHVIFEGAQGLLLNDDNYHYFPHLTRSQCGLMNVAKICAEAQIKTVHAVYATRAYATRHGAGPFPTERANLSYTDPTNPHNLYQGSLRFGILNVDLLLDAIAGDITKISDSTHSLAVTCLDQIDGSIEYLYQGRVLRADRTELLDLLKKTLSRFELSWRRGTTKLYYSTSPSGAVSVHSPV